MTAGQTVKLASLDRWKKNQEKEPSFETNRTRGLEEA
jgi:hypothetical protein